MKNLFNSTCRILFLSFIFIIFANINLFADEPDVVAIIPFKMNAQKDLTFLQDGIYDMLASRLSRAGKVQIVGREETERALETVTGPVNEISARETGEKLDADFILFGSLTVFGNSVSIDAKMIDVSGSRPTLAFFDQSQGMDGVIPQINTIAGDINEKAFGIKTSVKPLSEPEKKPEEKPAIYAHPEKLLETAPVRKDTGRVNSSPFEMNEGFRETPGFWKSRNLKLQIKGLSLGDVDGDGKNETILISNQKIHIYRYEKDRFLKIKEISGRGHQKFVSVDTADINKNGFEEIFVTSINKNAGSLDSFVIEWNGKDFTTILKGEKWYFRVLDSPQRGSILFGQKRGVSDLFLTGIHELVWNNNRYESNDKFRLPKGITVFGFAVGDIMNNGEEMVVALDKYDHLRIYSHNNMQEWKSEEYYGGSENYLEFGKESESRVFLSHRILITDLNRNGKNEVTVVKNHSSSGRTFERYRTYSGGQIESLSWDGLGLTKIWHTRKVSGFFSDCAIADIDNDGRPELVVSVVNRKKGLIQKAKSCIIVYELNELGKN